MWWTNNVFQLKHYRSHLTCHAQIIVQDAITITEKGLKISLKVWCWNQTKYGWVGITVGLALRILLIFYFIYLFSVNDLTCISINISVFPQFFMFFPEVPPVWLLWPLAFSPTENVNNLIKKHHVGLSWWVSSFGGALASLLYYGWNTWVYTDLCWVTAFGPYSKCH